MVGCIRMFAMLQNCLDYHFLVIVKKERKKSDDGHDYDRVSAAVQLIGTESEANNFSYK